MEVLRGADSIVLGEMCGRPRTIREEWAGEKAYSKGCTLKRKKKQRISANKTEQWRVRRPIEEQRSWQ